MSETSRSSLGVKLFITFAALLFLAAGIASFVAYFNQRALTNKLVEKGIETDADVISVTEISQRRGSRFELLVSFDIEGSNATGLADVNECSEQTYEEGTDTVRIVYDPDDSEVARLAECVESVDSWVPIIAGAAFTGIGVLLASRLPKVWSD
jgi:hypothetical protein